MKRYVKSSSTSGLIGIWWIRDNQVVADYKTVDQGYNDGSFINYDEKKNHLTEWSRLIKEYFPEEADQIIQKGYKSLERGRVIYNLRTQCYEVFCSHEVFSDLEKRKLIIDAFDLRGCRVDFEHDF